MILKTIQIKIYWKGYRSPLL